MPVCKEGSQVYQEGSDVQTFAGEAMQRPAATKQHPKQSHAKSATAKSSKSLLQPSPPLPSTKRLKLF